jgi:hypothetical protein
MCRVLTGKHESPADSMCGCEVRPGCHTPGRGEIGNLEEHRKILQDRINTIDKKITGLKTVKEP